MKKFLVTVIIGLAFTTAFAQVDSDKVLTPMGQLVDQYNVAFDKNVKGTFTVVYVPGADDPFTKVYGKFKGKKQTEKNMIFVGGFAAMFDAEWTPAMMKSHLQKGITDAYGKDSFRILLDLEDKAQKALNVKTIAIIKLKAGKIAEVKEYGENRKEFLDVVSTYFAK